ncbi:MAG: XRE family transcriptional regulator [Pontibacterium sp.]
MVVENVSLANRLKLRMSELGLSQREVAERTGMSQVAIHNLTSGKSLATRKITELATTLNCSAEWLQQGVSQSQPAPENYTNIPFLDVELAAGNGKHIDTEQVEEWIPISTEWILENRFSKHALAAVTVKGDSMVPRLQDGDAILVNTEDRTPTSGNIYAIAVDSELRVKRLIKRMDGAWIISSDNKSNPAYQDEVISHHNFEQLRIIGRAVKVIMGSL